MLHKLLHLIHPRRPKLRRLVFASAAEQHPPLEDVVYYLIQRLDEHVRLLNEISPEQAAAPQDTTGKGDT